MASSVVRVNSLISLRLPEVKGLRNVRGQFRSAQGAMRERNGRFAERYQAQVVHNMEAKIAGGKRAAASSGRLLRVTADPENAQYDTFRIGVGDRQFLNNSIARYWRTFEEGSAAVWKHPFTGTQLMPKTGKSGDEEGSSRPPYPVAHGKIPGIRTTSASLPWMDGKKFVVKHEIAPANVYRDATQQVDALRFGRENVRQFLNDVLGRDLR